MLLALLLGALTASHSAGDTLDVRRANASAAGDSGRVESAIVADRIVVEKGRRRLTLLRNGVAVRRYSVALGQNPVGAKRRRGDMRTPEGTYSIEARVERSRYHLALRISYPSAADVARARALGVSPGGDIMIHGLPNGRGSVGAAHRQVDWTEGCIAVTNEEIEEIWRAVPLGTVIEIRP
jgi:murein L,D-transpeptidase YafK